MSEKTTLRFSQKVSEHALDLFSKTQKNVFFEYF